MRIKYCSKYAKYVGKQHCEFFNDGHHCEFARPHGWSSIKELLEDDDRPKQEVETIGKPFRCDLLNQGKSGSKVAVGG